MANYVREVDQDYQYCLDDCAVKIVTAEANYSSVYHKRHDTPEEAIADYWHIKATLAHGKTIYEACGISPASVTTHVMEWETQRIERNRSWNG